MDVTSVLSGGFLGAVLSHISKVIAKVREGGKTEGSILTKLDDITERLRRVEEKIDQIEEIVRQHASQIGSLQGKVERANGAAARGGV